MSTPSPTYAELEIGLYRIEAPTYQADLRFTDPGSEAESPPARGTATFDLAELLALQHDPPLAGIDVAVLGDAEPLTRAANRGPALARPTCRSYFVGIDNGTS
ncbi:MAG: hypothetical protein GY856_36585 [bacterium]|nr:hypothetical protein [bacterium]